MARFDPNLFYKSAEMQQRNNQQLGGAFETLASALIQRQQQKDLLAKQEIKEANDPKNILLKMQQGLPVTQEQQAIAQLYAQSKPNPVTGGTLFPQAFGQQGMPQGAQAPMQDMQEQSLMTQGLSPKGKIEAEKAAIQEQMDIRKEQRQKTEGQKAADKEFAKEYTAWRARGGYGDFQKQINQLREVQNQLARGDEITGAGTGIASALLPRALEGAFMPEATAAREAVEEVVQRNLREILGAQFTEKEGERLISRAFNPSLSPEENSKRIGRLIQQMETAGRAKESASRYFEQYGTLKGWQGEMPKLEDFESSVSGVIGTPTVSTQAEYDALPSGAEFIEDGVKYRKP